MGVAHHRAYLSTHAQKKSYEALERARNLSTGFTSLLMIDDFPNRIDLSGTFEYASLTACVAMPMQAVEGETTAAAFVPIHTAAVGHATITCDATVVNVSGP